MTDWQNMVKAKRMADAEITDGTREYYDRTTTETAVQVAREFIEEWDHSDDAHGYCHTRPMLVRLVEIAERAGY